MSVFIPDEIPAEELAAEAESDATPLSSQSLLCRGRQHVVDHQVVMFMRPLTLSWNDFLLQAAEAGWLYDQTECGWRCPDCVRWYHDLVGGVGDTPRQ